MGIQGAVEVDPFAPRIGRNGKFLTLTDPSRCAPVVMLWMGRVHNNHGFPRVFVGFIHELGKLFGKDALVFGIGLTRHPTGLFVDKTQAMQSRLESAGTHATFRIGNPKFGFHPDDNFFGVDVKVCVLFLGKKLKLFGSQLAGVVHMIIGQVIRQAFFFKKFPVIPAPQCRDRGTNVERFGRLLRAMPFPELDERSDLNVVLFIALAALLPS